MGTSTIQESEPSIYASDGTMLHKVMEKYYLGPGSYNLKALDGINDVVVDLEHSQVVVKGNKINLDDIEKAIQRIGYEYLGEVT